MDGDLTAKGMAGRLFGLDSELLQALAWRTRSRHFPPRLDLAVPGARAYCTEHYRNDPRRFAAISLTGTRCALACAHCERQLLEAMYAAPTPAALAELGRLLVDRGCEGVLLSGGADANGAVPLSIHLEAIAGLKALGLQVIVHTGLVDRETSIGLREAGVDQALCDVIGDSDTIRQVYGLASTPADYAHSLNLLMDAGLSVAPHIVIGLHFGRLRGELAALEIVRHAGADVLVLVVLRPLPGTPMAGVVPPSPDDVGRLAAVARALLPDTPLTLGCARPVGPHKIEMERQALLAGVNAIAYPDPETVRLADELGLETAFRESCCTVGLA